MTDLQQQQKHSELGIHDITHDPLDEPCVLNPVAPNRAADIGFSLMVGFCLHSFSVSLFEKFLCLSSFALQKNKKKTHTNDCVVLSPASKCVFKCLIPNLKTPSRLHYIFDVKH